jgi:CxxC-x17-CxxC domain-containing protein
MEESLNTRYPIPLYKNAIEILTKTASLISSLLKGAATVTFMKRQMVYVSTLKLKCDDCGKEIQELPSQASMDRPIYCSDCAPNHHINVWESEGGALESRLKTISQLGGKL